MNFWATVEHSLNYKYQGDFPAELADRLQRAAAAAFKLDQEMSEIREEIQEAQNLFSYGKSSSWERASGRDQEEQNDNHQA